MNIAEQLPKILIALFVLGGGAVIVSKIINPSSGSVVVDVKVPKLSEQANRGKISFDENCAQCHGENASGSDNGPPLVHNIYNPGHHSDMAFRLAAKRGVQRHHWNFGNMPQQPQVNEKQMESVVFYVRELQMANGIFYQEHKMQ